mmetsp:Transcript_3164/g.8403  ORF Transcript_3164/g.8403 Transcript_3164/m.8403 type:complete len:201 (+) Transcript_3164:335-937(+)
MAFFTASNGIIVLHGTIKIFPMPVIPDALPSALASAGSPAGSPATACPAPIPLDVDLRMVVVTASPLPTPKAMLLTVSSPVTSDMTIPAPAAFPSDFKRPPLASAWAPLTPSEALLVTLKTPSVAGAPVIVNMFFSSCRARVAAAQGAMCAESRQVASKPKVSSGLVKVFIFASRRSVCGSSRMLNCALVGSRSRGQSRF